MSILATAAGNGGQGFIRSGICKDRFDNSPVLIFEPWPIFAKRLTSFDVGEKDGPGFMTCARNEPRRGKGAAIAADMLCLDIEKGAPPFDDVVVMLDLFGWNYAVYTTHSHTPEEPRYRVVVPTETPLEELDRLEGYCLGLAQSLGVDSACVDKASWDRERLMYLPRRKEDSTAYKTASRIDGVMLHLTDLPYIAPEDVQKPPQIVARQTSGSIPAIAAFNEKYSVADVLERNGYQVAGSNRYHPPGDITGEPGVRLFPDSGRVYSHHANDPLNTEYEGHAHDAFDCFRLLEHGGDMAAALNAAGNEFTTIDPGTGEEITLNECYHRQKALQAFSQYPVISGEWLSQSSPYPANLSAYFVNLKSANDEAPLRWVLDQWMPCGEVTLMAAHGGAGKSYVGLVLGVHVVMGWQFGGVAVDPGRVLFVSCEDPAGEMRRRLRRIVEHYTLNLNEVAERLDVLDLSDTDPTLHGASGPTRLLSQMGETVKSRDYRLIIIDNASDAYAGNEIERAAVKTFIRGLRQQMSTPDRAVLLLAHVNKQSAGSNRQKGATEDYSGSTAWHNSVRSRWSLESAGADAMTLQHQKSNRGALQHPIRIEWQVGVPVVVLPRAVTGDAAEIIEYENREAQLQAELRKQANALALLGFIREFYKRGEFIATSPQARNNARTMLGGQPNFPCEYKAGSGCADLLREMERDGLIERETYRTPSRKDAERWKLTAAGEARIPAATDVDDGP